jgi:DNA-binding LacI/PurR family transcriptional regulator
MGAMLEAEQRHRRVTIVDIARRLGVTPATVSNAFNHPDQLSAALRAEVLSTATAMGYLGPDPAARGMRRGRLRTLGVLYSDTLANAFADPAFVLVLQGLAGAAEEAGVGMTLLPGWPRETRRPATVQDAMVDGFVIYSMADDDPLVAAAVARRLPLVIIDSPRLPDALCVGIDDEAAAHTAADHLVALGHRRFGIISGELSHARRSGQAGDAAQAAASYGVNRSRLRGYQSALTAAGIDWRDVVVEEAANEPEREAAAAAARLLSRARPPTALLAMSDRLARGALAGIQGLGLGVPADVSLVGFDDDPEAKHSVPALTTIAQPHVEKGRIAGQLLIDLLRGKRPASPPALPTHLVVRTSTAPPA